MKLKWYWLQDGDNHGYGWHDCNLAGFSFIVGGPDGASVKKSYRGPWFPRFCYGNGKDEFVGHSSFDSLRSAKQAAVAMGILWMIGACKQTLKLADDLLTK